MTDLGDAEEVSWPSRGTPMRPNAGNNCANTATPVSEGVDLIDESLEVWNELVVVVTDIGRERRLTDRAGGGYGATDKDGADPAERAALEERDRLLARSAVLGRLEHRHRAQKDAVLQRQFVDRERLAKDLGGGR